MRSAVAATLLLGSLRVAFGQPAVPEHAVEPPRSIRLYVLDCGSLHVADPSRFGLSREELAPPELAVACYLVVHPKGSLLWDAGAVPDNAWKPGGGPAEQASPLGRVTVTRRLTDQLTEAGIASAAMTYLAFSDYRGDHTGNANTFAKATWLVRQVEREAMFAETPPPLTEPASYASLRDSKTVMIEREQYDVFGDGTVVIKAAPGPTPGHQLLYVKLAKTGGVLLSGDVYYSAAARTLARFPTFDFDHEKAVASRATIEAFLKSTGAQLWIQHDVAAHSKLKKAPQYYE